MLGAARGEMAEPGSTTAGQLHRTWLVGLPDVSEGKCPGDRAGLDGHCLQPPRWPCWANSHRPTHCLGLTPGDEKPSDIGPGWGGAQDIHAGRPVVLGCSYGDPDHPSRRAGKSSKHIP